MQRPSRRHFLQSMGSLGLAVAGLGALAACASRGRLIAPAPGEVGPETTTIKLLEVPAMCLAPQKVAEDLLHAEGFTDVQYVRTEGLSDQIQRLGAGEAHFSMQFAGALMLLIDRGSPVVMVGGVHTGCYELFGTDRIHSISDLKGRSVAVQFLESGPHIYLSAMMAYIGLDPRTDVTWVTAPSADAMAMLARGEVDAFLGFPPEPQQLQAQGIGHVVVNTATDKPWSQYYCCMVVGNRDFVQQHPVATRRALRAILKATDICATDPSKVAEALVSRGYLQDRALAEQVLRDVPYSHWREYDPEDTSRFYALKMYEAGMVKTSPNQLIAQAADWRFFNELKQELKA